MDIKKARLDLRMGKTIYDMDLKVGYYARVSTDKDDQLNSLDNQQKYFEEMIKENKKWIFVKGYIDEGISATGVRGRNSFKEMLEDASNHKLDLILTKEISRFSRNTIDSIKYTEYLLQNGVIVYFLSDNLNTIYEDSEFRLTIMSSLAQDEVRKLSERVKFGINRMIKDGKLIGGNLTGYYKKDGTYLINPKEAKIIEYLFKTYVSGNTSLKKISLDLANLGYYNSKGCLYSATTLAKFLTNPRYKGFYTARLTEVENYKTHKKRKIAKDKQIIYKDDKIPAIVSEELWDKANSLYEMRKRKPSRHIYNTMEHLNNYKYSNKLFCHDCGSVFIRNGGSNRFNNPIWTCKTYRTKGLGKCASPNIKESFLDKIFIEVFIEFLKNKKDYKLKIFNEYKNIIMNNNNNLDITNLNNKIKSIKMYKDKLLDLSLKGIINDLEFKSRNDKFNLELKELQKSLDNSSNDILENNELDKLELWINNNLEVENNLPYLINLLVDKVIVIKVDNNRKNINLKISFTFNAPSIEYNLNFVNKCSCINRL